MSKDFFIPINSENSDTKNVKGTDIMHTPTAKKAMRPQTPLDIDVPPPPSTSPDITTVKQAKEIVKQVSRPQTPPNSPTQSPPTTLPDTSKVFIKKGRNIGN